jgi:hypothetical protein
MTPELIIWSFVIAAFVVGGLGFVVERREIRAKREDRERVREMVREYWANQQRSPERYEIHEMIGYDSWC